MSTTVAELAAFLPRDRAAQIRSGAPLAAEGAALIADISGFTPLTEALARELSPARGAEELTRALNGVFAPLIAQVGRYGGSVIKFAGDALIVWFPRAPRARRDVAIRRALAAAAGMQAAIARHGQVSTPAGPFTLTMKVGIAYGPALRARLGDPLLGYEDVIGGATLDRMAEAEHHAGPGEIVLDPAGIAAAATLAAVTEQRAGYLVVSGPARPVAPARRAQTEAGADEGMAEALRPYLPGEIVEAIGAGRSQPAELKPVVSIFVQFQGIVYEEGPAAEAQLGAYFAAAQASAARYGGRVNRLLTGDKGSVLHLIFGAPRAVEDLERRAALCLLDLRRAAGELGFISAQRIGAAAGRAFAGPVGSPERRDYTLMGDAINLSARLMQGAESGQIVVDPTLAARLAGAFALEDLGAARLKGKAAPVARYALLGQLRQAPRQAARAYGRSMELAALRRQIDQLAHGAGGVTLLIGDLGMGKSHLLAALRESAVLPSPPSPRSPRERSDEAILWAGAAAAGYGQPRSGALIAAALGDLLGLAGAADPAAQLGDGLAELLGAQAGAAAWPYLARFMGLPLDPARERELAALAGESLRWRIFELLGAIVRAACARRPLVLALDDLQWADPTSLELVESLLPLSRELPLLLILASRPPGVESQESGVSRIAQRLPTPDSRLLKIELGGLDEAAALAVVAQHAPGIEPAARAQLAARGQGNPLFLVELARTAAQGGDPDELPDSVQGLLLAQIDRLPGELRETLQLAAILGPSFAPRLLAALSGPGAPLDARLDALEAAGFLLRAGAGYSFRHTLIRESAYGAMLYARRRGHHGAAAAAIERLYPTRLAELSGELAAHYERAEHMSLAARYHGQAADGARLLYANAEAEAGYRHVLRLLEPGGDAGLRARTYLKLAQVRMNGGDYAAAQELYDVAFGMLEREETNHTRAAAARRPFRLGVYEHGPSTLDPAYCDMANDNEIVKDLFEGLVGLDSDLNSVPAVARRWRIDEEGTLYTFELQPNLYWSDGTALTADDVAFAIRRNLHPSTGAGLAYQLYMIAGAEAFHQGRSDDPTSIGIQVIDQRTLQIRVISPLSPLLFLLSQAIAFPQPAHVIAKYPQAWTRPRHYVTNGVFYVAGWNKDQPTLLARNPHYSRYTSGNIRRVELRYTPPSREHFLQKSIDWLRVEDRSDFSDEKTAPVELLGLTTYFLAFSCAHPFCAQRELRLALAQTIDKHQLVAQAWGGVQIPALGGLVPPSIPGHSPGISHAYSPESARALAHIPAEVRAGSLVLASRPSFHTTPELLAASWRQQLGISVEVRTDLPWETMLRGLREGSIAMALFGWELEYPDPEDILRSLFYSSSPLNDFRWHHARFDQLLDTAARQHSQPQRLALYHQAEHLLIHEQVIAVPLYYHRAFGLLRQGFSIARGEKIIRGDRFRLKHIVADQG